MNGPRRAMDPHVGSVDDGGENLDTQVPNKSPHRLQEGGAAKE